MTYIKSAKKGLIFIGLIMVLNATIWLLADPVIEQSLESTVAQILGANLLIGFTLVFFLSTKNRFVNWLFNGLENVYATHRWLAMITVLLIFVHSQTAYLIVQYFRDGPLNAAAMGPLARNLFIGLIVLALLAKYMKYEHWRYIHRLMIIPYLLAFYHAVFISSYSLMSLSILGIWTALIGLTGVASSVYMILIYRKQAFTYKGSVVSKTLLNDDITEFEVEITQPLDFKAGQFVFLKINKKPFNGVPHPFSVSGYKDNRLFFTIKALGDYTEAIKKHLEKGDQVELTKPYGHMTFEDFPSSQVWLAGGVGITPFLSYVRNMDAPQEKITLYYSVKNKKEAVHLDLFESVASKYENFNFVFSESDKDGFLKIDDLDLSNHPHVFMCGPLPMAKTFKNQFKASKAHRALTYEAFSFTGTLVEDGLGTLKRLKAKVKA